MSISATVEAKPAIGDAVVYLLGELTSVSILDDVSLREHLLQLERGQNALAAAQASTMREMHRRAVHADRADELDQGAAGQTGQLEEFVVDEIAALLACTKMSASHRFSLAQAAGRYPALHAAWASGSIDARKVSEIAEQVTPMDQPDTVGSLAAEPVVDAAIEYAKERTVPQLRAWLKRRVIEAAPEVAERRRIKALADRRVTLTPVGDGMAELWALIPAAPGLHIRKLLDSLAMSSGRSSNRSSNDASHGSADDGSAGDLRTADQRRADALVDLIIGDAPAPAVDISLVVSAETVCGASAGPAELVGYGPVTFGQVRELVGDATGALGDLSWRRLLADPTSGVLTDVAQDRYRPSSQLDRAVRARDMTCRFPGCRRSATGNRSGVDLDHTEAWPVGETSAHNLAALCRHHHRLKHEAGWTVSLDAEATMTWTTPSGSTFVTRPWEYSTPLPDDLRNREPSPPSKKSGASPPSGSRDRPRTSPP